MPVTRRAKAEILFSSGIAPSPAPSGAVRDKIRFDRTPPPDIERFLSDLDHSQKIHSSPNARSDSCDDNDPIALAKESP